MKYFSLFACCIPTKGINRSILSDAQRQSYRFIPNDLYEILLHIRNQSIDEIKKGKTYEDQETIDEYFQTLIDEEYGFLTDKPSWFPGIELNYEYPGWITNCIIDADRRSDHDYKLLFDKLTMLKCQDIQLRFYDRISLKYLRLILQNLEGSIVKSIEILMPDSEEANAENLKTLSDDFHRIQILTLHSSLKNEVISGKIKSSCLIFKTKQIIDSEECCGIISKNNFSINIQSISESAIYNSCLNKKLSIDKYGNVKNCPSMKKSYGKYTDLDLLSLVKTKDFSSFWTLTKNEIEVCKDCEFRNICTDCRAYTKEQSALGKPLKCKYDPYKMEWKG